MSQEAIAMFLQRRKRGTTKGSITRIRLKDLSKQVTEGSLSEVISHAKLLLNKHGFQKMPFCIDQDN